MGSVRSRALRRDLERDGWTFSKSRAGHWRGTHPSIPDGFLVLPGTMGGGRSEANARSLARRMLRASRDTVDSSP